MSTAVLPIDPAPRVDPARAAALPPDGDGPGISTQNTILDTAPLSARLPRVEGKTMMADDGSWITGVPIARERDGKGGQRETPADGSINLLEAMHRHRAMTAYRRLFENCSPAEQIPGGAS